MIDKEEKYDLWFPQKKQMDANLEEISFRPREVWWCHIGVNVGYEIFGKGDGFTRPVLIIRKYSDFTFLAAPLSTTAPRYKIHVPIRIGEQQGIVRLDQLRTFDRRRLGAFIGALPRQQFKDIKAILRREF